MFAIILCLFLVVCGVVCELTDDDVAKIDKVLTARFDARDERLYDKFDKMLTARFDVFSANFSAQMKDVITSIDELKFSVSSFHAFNRRRVEAIQFVSVKRKFCQNANGNIHYGTSHSVTYKGKVATLFTPHASCFDSPEFHPTNNGTFFLHHTFDLAIDRRCSSSSAALDISSSVVPFLGDEIITFAFGDNGYVWQGLVSANVVNNCSVAANHWKDDVQICRGEIIAQGHQHAGMSGGAVLNGCGYLGMTHAVSRSNANFAYIISAAEIIKFIEKHLNELPELADCKQRSIVPPVAPLADCAAKTPQEVTINASEF